VLTLNEICSTCNGNFYYYKNFNIEHHYKNLFNTIRRVFTRSTGWEALYKIRVSPDLLVKELYTPVLTNNLDLLILPVVDGDQTFSLSIEYKEESEIKKLFQSQANSNSSHNQMNGNYYNTGNTYDSSTSSLELAYIQTAILYTHTDGSRRIRVTNYALQKCHILDEYLQSLDLESVSSLFTKLIINNLYTLKKMDIAHQKFQSSYYENAIYNVTECYKKYKKEGYFLKNFPLYTIGMIKHRINCLDEITHSMDVDLSNYLRIKILKSNVEDVMSYINPKIYNLKMLLPMYHNEDLLSYNENGELRMPSLVQLTLEKIEKDSVYLIDNGYILILYFNFISADLRRYIMNLFFKQEERVNDVSFMAEDNVLYCEYESEEEKIFKEKIIVLIDNIRAIRTNFQNLVFIISGSPSEAMVKEVLVEDNFCPWFKHSLREMARLLI
jgi:protein transport protein SEC24